MLLHVFGRLGLTEGLERFVDGIDRLIDGLCRLEFAEKPEFGATDLDRLDIRLCKPLFDRDADGIRLICGLDLELKDRDPTDGRFITDGRDCICDDARGAVFLMLCRDAEPFALLRPRRWA